VHQCCADATERGGLKLPHQLADILHLARPRAVRVHPLHGHHGLVQGLLQRQPDQLGGGQGDELDSECL
jgi:hypothetical protein